jgi:hypothetical protein
MSNAHLYVMSHTVSGVTGSVLRIQGLKSYISADSYAASFENLGTIVHEGTTELEVLAELHNRGIYEIRGSGWIKLGSNRPNTPLRNYGLLIKSSGSGTARIYDNGIVDNQGTIEAASGTLSLQSKDMRCLQIDTPAEHQPWTLLGGTWKATDAVLEFHDSADDKDSVRIGTGRLRTVGPDAAVILSGTGSIPKLSGGNGLRDINGTFGVHNRNQFVADGMLNMGSASTLQFGLNAPDWDRSFPAASSNAMITAAGNVILPAGSRIMIDDSGGIDQGEYVLIRCTSGSISVGDIKGLLEQVPERFELKVSKLELRDSDRAMVLVLRLPGTIITIL